jgi:hypothetical protein
MVHELGEPRACMLMDRALLKGSAIIHQSVVTSKHKLVKGRANEIEGGRTTLLILQVSFGYLLQYVQT